MIYISKDKIPCLQTFQTIVESVTIVACFSFVMVETQLWQLFPTAHVWSQTLHYVSITIWLIKPPLVITWVGLKTRDTAHDGSHLLAKMIINHQNQTNPNTEYTILSVISHCTGIPIKLLVTIPICPCDLLLIVQYPMKISNLELCSSPNHPNPISISINHKHP